MSNVAAEVMSPSDRERWSALTILCLGLLMIAINATIVNVALPSIGSELHFSNTALVWVVNSYLASYGGFLLLGGRLGDFFGHRRVFFLGIMLFTLASLGCALADSPGALVVARCVQGVGGAIGSTVALSLITTLFTDGPTRAKALGLCAFVGASGGSIGSFLGGILTSVLSWHWIFLVNVPIGVGVCSLCLTLLRRSSGRPTGGRLDVAGAVTVTAALMLAVYAIINGHQVGWRSAQTLGLLVSAGGLLLLFVGIETQAQTPLMPPVLFRTRNIVVANIAAVLLAGTIYSWNFFLALYLQRLLLFSPLQVGLTFLPANLITALMSLTVAPKLVIRFGIRLPLVVGMLTAAVGQALLAGAAVNGNVALDVLPGMLLVGLGTGAAYSPLLLGALTGVSRCDSGAASGSVNTSFTMGGSLGLSLLANIASARTDDLLASGVSMPLALNSGYHIAFSYGAVFAAIAAVITGVFLGTGQLKERGSGEKREAEMLKDGAQ